MKCPVDETVLQMTDRQGIEIDYCPQCRGVWLDRGELDKVIERSAGESSGSAYDQPAPPAFGEPPRPSYQRSDDSRGSDDYRRSDNSRRSDDYRRSDDSRRSDDYRRDSGHSKKRKKEGFLGELFDF